MFFGCLLFTSFLFVSYMPRCHVRRFNHTPQQSDVLITSQWKVLWDLAHLNHWFPYASLRIVPGYSELTVRPTDGDRLMKLPEFVTFLAVFLVYADYAFNIQWNDTVLKSSDCLLRGSWVSFVFLPLEQEPLDRISVRVCSVSTAFTLDTHLVESKVSLNFPTDYGSATALYRVVYRYFESVL
jgi:hypothetical protein